MTLKNDPFTIEPEPMRNPFVGIPTFLMAPICFDLDRLGGRYCRYRHAI